MYYFFLNNNFHVCFHCFHFLLSMESEIPQTFFKYYHPPLNKNFLLFPFFSSKVKLQMKEENNNN